MLAFERFTKSTSKNNCTTFIILVSELKKAQSGHVSIFKLLEAYVITFAYNSLLTSP